MTTESPTTSTDERAATVPSDGSGLERVIDPIHHVAFGFEPGDGCIWAHTWFEPGGYLPEHFHPSLEEHWEAVEGTLRGKVDGTWHELTPEDGPVVIAPNVRHAVSNDSGRPAHGLAKVIPGGRLEEFLTEASLAAQQGLFNERNLPTSLKGALWLAKFAYRFRDETVMVSPPPALQRILLPPIARLAR
jgi:quercetin dioxygenase-like cupin family protein